MSHRIPARYLCSYWRYFTQRHGMTDPNTAIDAISVGKRAYQPTFTGICGTRVIVELDAPMPKPLDARNRLRDLLWAAHTTGAICLMTEPARQENAA